MVERLLNQIKELETTDGFIDCHQSTIKFLERLSPFKYVVEQGHNPPKSVNIIWDRKNIVLLKVHLIHNSLYQGYGEIRLLPFQYGRYCFPLRESKGIIFEDDFIGAVKMMDSLSQCAKCKKVIVKGYHHHEC